jgi:Skp family chaperone for outer membrane proteins
MRQTRKFVARALTALALATVCAISAYAQDDAARPKIAIVSLARVQAGYTKLHEQEAELGAWLDQRRTFHDELTNFVFLPKKDFEESVALMDKPRPLGETDQARLDELRRISDKNEERFSALRATPTRTADETAEFNALQDLYDASVATLRTVQQSIVNDLGTRRETALTGLMDTVQQAVDKTAQDFGYDLVIDADMVFFGGDDITDVVIELLNSGTGLTEPAPAPAPAAPEQPAEPGATQGQQGGEGGGQETGGQGG